MAGQFPSQIAHYSISHELGRGGMGVVYLAHDTRLARDVAIKAMPEELSSDPARLERFEREARTLASLDHPNLGGIYGLEEQDGKRYLILEYIDGETLSDRLDRGALPADEAFELAIQIAEGLEAAHDAGIVHRDLKPANIKITSEGKAKVIDFGLARIDETASSSSALSQSPTLTSPAAHSPTIAGVILGTAAYMSPEQARGRKVDKRTDIWSFGVVLFEMLAGASPFVGETVSDSIGAVLHKPLDLDRIPPSVPPSVRRVLTRCVERDKAQRYRDVGDARIDLARALTEDDAMSARTGPRWGGAAWAALAFLVALAGGAGWFASSLSGTAPPTEVRKFDVFADQTLNEVKPRISPNGKSIAYVLNDLVHIRDLRSFDSRAIMGTDGAESVWWSPDSQWLAFAKSNRIFKVPASGGGVSELGLSAGLVDHVTGAWTGDGRILFTSNALDQDGLYSMPSRGGSATQELPVDLETMIDFHEIVSIPNTNIILVNVHKRDGGFRIEAHNGAERAVVHEINVQGVFGLAWSPTGHVLYGQGYGQEAVWAIGFSPERMRSHGEPFLVLNDAGEPSVSNDGTLAVRRGTRTTGGDLVWVTPGGDIETVTGGFDFIMLPSVSPDGSKIMFTAGDEPQSADVWIHDLERDITSRLTYYDSMAGGMAWSADGSEVAVLEMDFANAMASKTRFFAADGSGETRESIPGVLALNADWSLACRVLDPRDPRSKVEAITLDDPESPINDDVVPTNVGIEFVLSPDGAFLAYVSYVSGSPEIYCTRFPSGEGKWQISRDGGVNPLWSPDGNRLYFWNDDVYSAVDVVREPSLSFGVPTALFQHPSIFQRPYPITAPAPDGERFIAVRQPLEVDLSPTISVIQNWHEEFRDQGGQ